MMNYEESVPNGSPQKKMLLETMSTTFRLNADELEPSFVEKIKTLFAHKDIAVTIYEEDETERIRANPGLHRRLMEAVDRVDHREGLVDVDVDSLK
jgi:hypothetical protein